MAEKDRGLLNDLVELPWWVSVILSVAVYAALTWVVPIFTEGQSISRPLTSFFESMAPIAALVLLLVAAVSAYYQLRQGKLLERQTGQDSEDEPSRRQFEGLVSEAFRRKGFMVLDNIADGPDGAVDIWLRKDGEVSFVQCKHWKTLNVGVSAVRELYGVMAAESVRHGVIVTYGGFTPEAREFAGANSIELLDGPQLTELIAAVQQSGNMQVRPEAAPSCPRCGSAMVLRVARKGPYAGKKFWGCSRFPECRGLVFAGD